MKNIQADSKRVGQILGLTTSLAGTITASDFIDVAVVGQFKAGKSSFINSLLGEAKIPNGFLTVTAVITRVCYGERIEKPYLEMKDELREMIIKLQKLKPDLNYD